jgi:hypothetical protein
VGGEGNNWKGVCWNVDLAREGEVGRRFCKKGDEEDYTPEVKRDTFLIIGDVLIPCIILKGYVCCSA